MTPALQHRLLVRTDRSADAAESAVGHVWRLILAALDTPGPPHAVAARVAHAARQLPTVGANVLADLEAGARDAARLTAADIARRLPARAVARLRSRGRRWHRPAGLLEDESPVALEELADLILPPLLPSQVRAVVYRGGWWDRVAALSKLADPGVLAAKVAAGVQQGWTVQRIAADIRPAVQGVVTSARRVARTAGLWVMQAAELHVYEEGLGDIITGYTVRAMHDERTRPKHAARDGTEYYRQPKPGQKGFDEMPRPPQESPKDGSTFAFNCRCRLDPILSPDL